MYDLHNNLLTALKNKPGDFKEIGLLGDFASLDKMPPGHKLPAAYIIPTGEQALNNDFTHKQTLTITTAVMIIADLSGNDWDQQFGLNGIRNHVRNQFKTLQSFITMPTFDRGALEQIDNHVIIWRDQYKTKVSII